MSPARYWFDIDKNNVQSRSANHECWLVDKTNISNIGIMSKGPPEVIKLLVALCPHIPPLSPGTHL